VVACGGGSSSTRTTNTTQAADAAFVAAANKVCIASDRRVFKIGRLTRDPKGWADTAASARLALREMTAIKPPPDRAEAYRQMMRFAGALTLAIEEVHGALVRKMFYLAATTQIAAAQLQDKVHAYARAAGLTFCQQPLTNWPA